MPEPVAAAVREECRILTAYVAGTEPDDLVVLSYARGLESSAFRAVPVEPIDEVLLSVARRGVLAAGLADAWARCFSPAGQLRRRLVLLIAILESTAPGYLAFEPAARGRLPALLALLAAGLGFGVRVLLSLPVVAIVRRFGPERAGRRTVAGAGRV